jgi:hypothetical protein
VGVTSRASCASQLPFGAMSTSGFAGVCIATAALQTLMQNEPKEPPQAGPSQPPGAAGASKLAGATMSAVADIVFCRAKSALQNVFQNETPSLSLRLSGFASGDTTATNGNSRAKSTQHRCTLLPFVALCCPPLIHFRGKKRQRLATNGNPRSKSTQQTATTGNTKATSKTSMDPKTRSILEAVPDSPTRSKLEPFRDLIKGLRQKRKTYREIAHILNLNCGLHVNQATIYKFVRVRSNPNRRIPLQLPDSESNTAPPPNPLAHTPPGPRKRFHYDPEEGLTLSDEALNLKPRKD